MSLNQCFAKEVSLPSKNSFICYTSSFRKIEVGSYVQGHQIKNISQVPEAPCSSVHSMSKRHIGEIMSKDIIKHCSTKTITKGLQGLFTLILTP